MTSTMRTLTVGGACLGILCGTAARAQEAAPADTGWQKTLAIGGSLTDGNSETMSINAGFAAARVSGQNEYELGLDVNYGETSQTTTDAEGNEVTDTETTVQNGRVFGIYRRTFDHSFAYSDNSVLHDDIASIEHRAVLGVGLGRRLIEDDTTKLNGELGVAYVDEAFTDDTDDQYAALRIAETVEVKLSETAKVWQGIEYLPRADEFDDYLLNAEVGIEAAISAAGNMAMRVVAIDRYDSTPAAGVDKNDLMVIGSIVWKL